MRLLVYCCIKLLCLTAPGMRGQVGVNGSTTPDTSTPSPGPSTTSTPSTAPSTTPTPQGPTTQTLSAQTPWTAGDGSAGSGGTPSGTGGSGSGSVTPPGGGALFNQGPPAAASGIAAGAASGAATTAGVKTEAAVMSVSPGQTLAHGDHVVTSVAANAGTATSVTNAAARGSGGVTWGRRLLRDTA